MTLETLTAKLLSDPKVKRHYEEMKMEFDIAKEIIKLRTKFKLTQRQLAEKAGIKQPQLARIETGKQLPRLDTLKLIAESCGYSVEVRLVPKEDEQTAEEFEEEYHRRITRVENGEYEFDKVVGTVYWWTKEPNDKFVGEENIVETKLDKEKLKALGLTLYASDKIVTSEQAEYLSEFMDNDIDLDEYDYFFEYFWEVSR